MNKSTGPIIFDVKRLRDFTEKIFEWTGVPKEDAKIAADVLIEEDLRKPEMLRKRIIK